MQYTDLFKKLLLLVVWSWKFLPNLGSESWRCRLATEQNIITDDPASVPLDGTMGDTYLSVRVTKCNVEGAHGPDDSYQGLYCITVHYWFELFVVFIGETSLMDDPETQKGLFVM